MIRTFFYFILVAAIVMSCGNTSPTVTDVNDSSALELSEAEKQIFLSQKNDTIHIENAKLEYDIVIIEPGFNAWLSSVARPREFYTQDYMEARNRYWVMQYNQRVLQPRNYDPNLYALQIDYQAHIDYGYEVNYQLFNYFLYFQRKYNQYLGGYYPRLF